MRRLSVFDTEPRFSQRSANSPIRRFDWSSRRPFVFPKPFTKGRIGIQQVKPSSRSLGNLSPFLHLSTCLDAERLP
eukprot:1183446-Pyramimonas_sp.AAC.1